MSNINDREEIIFRPSTRGQLVEKLKEGVDCEVAGHCSEMTAIMLRGWLNFNDFETKKSHNPGWIIFFPISKIEEE